MNARANGLGSGEPKKYLQQKLKIYEYIILKSFYFYFTTVYGRKWNASYTSATVSFLKKIINVVDLRRIKKIVRVKKEHCTWKCKTSDKRACGKALPICR